MEASLSYNFNLPYLVYKNNALGSFQDAMDVAVDMINRVDARCARVVDAIQRNEELIQREPKLNAYLATMVSCMSRTLRWSFETCRYGLYHDNGYHKHTIYSWYKNTWSWIFAFTFLTCREYISFLYIVINYYSISFESFYVIISPLYESYYSLFLKLFSIANKVHCQLKLWLT